MSKLDQINLKELSNEELRELNSRILQEFKRKQNIIAMSFRPGQKVEWIGKSKGYHTGTITKVNTKTIKVITDNGENWSVSPSLLKSI